MFPKRFKTQMFYLICYLYLHKIKILPIRKYTFFDNTKNVKATLFHVNKKLYKSGKLKRSLEQRNPVAYHKTLKFNSSIFQEI